MEPLYLPPSLPLGALGSLYLYLFQSEGSQSVSDLSSLISTFKPAALKSLFDITRERSFPPLYLSASKDLPQLHLALLGKQSLLHSLQYHAHFKTSSPFITTCCVEADVISSLYVPHINRIPPSNTASLHQVIITFCNLFIVFPSENLFMSTLRNDSHLHRKLFIHAQLLFLTTPQKETFTSSTCCYTFNCQLFRSLEMWPHLQSRQRRGVLILRSKLLRWHSIPFGSFL